MLRIGLSSCFFHSDPKRAIFKGKTLQYAEQSMVRWIQSAGVLVYAIPSIGPESRVSLEQYVADLDGLVLQGGSDVSPTSYGETPLRPEWSGDRIRDDYEITLIHAFRKAGKPVLGVCRGLQILNVAFGGTLYQDITLQHPGALTHRDWEIYDQNHHAVTFTEGSWLRQAYAGASSGTVNTIHHQGIRKLGASLISEAVSSPDGIVEAIRCTAPGPWTYGVQWHPEFHAIREDGVPTPATWLGADPILEKFLTEAKSC